MPYSISVRRKAKNLDNPIYVWRQDKGLTPADIAGKLGVSESAVKFWERGEKIPCDKNLIPLAKLMRVKHHALLIQLQAQ